MDLIQIIISYNERALVYFKNNWRRNWITIWKNVDIKSQMTCTIWHCKDVHNIKKKKKNIKGNDLSTKWLK